MTDRRGFFGAALGGFMAALGFGPARRLKIQPSGGLMRFDGNLRTINWNSVMYTSLDPRTNRAWYRLGANGEWVRFQ